MVGLVFTSRREEDEHWWDADPLVKARQVEFEGKLNELIEDYGVTDPRHRRNGEDMNPWLKLALQVGVPAVIALYLVYQVTTDFKAGQTVIAQKLDTHIAMTSPVAESLRRLEAIALAQCVNAAVTSIERDRCAGNR